MSINRLLIKIAFSCSLLVLSCLLLFWDFGSSRDSGELRFFLLTLLLITYVSWEMYLCFLKEKWNVIVAPPVLASILTFVLSFGVTNYQFLGGDLSRQFFLLLSPDPFAWLNKALFCAILAAFFMWRGYNLFFGRLIGASLRRWLRKKGLVRKSLRIRWEVLFFCLVASLFARFLQIKLGLFGYNSDQESLYGLAAYKQFFDLFAGLGVLALMGLALSYFSREGGSRKYLLGMLILVLGMETLFGFLSGFKSLAILPCVLVGLCYYICTSKIPISGIIGTVVLLLASYQIIEPYRSIRHNDQGFDNRSMDSILGEMVGVVRSSDTGKSSISYIDRIMERSNYTLFAGISIAAEDKGRVNEQVSPDFLGNILKAPATAFIPRFFWSSKPLNNSGYWYNTEILKSPKSNTTSVGMSPVGYLYFAGGIVGVVLGFTLIGVTQRFLFEAFALSGGGGWVVYLVLLQALVVINHDVGTIFTSFLRYLPIMILAQYFLFVGVRSEETPAQSKFRVRSLDLGLY
jgi:hypothetical protein